MEHTSYLVRTPGICAGKLRIDGHRITVKQIVLWHVKLGQSLPEIAGTYDLPMAALHQAMAHYFDRKAEIDAELEADEKFVSELSADRPSLLANRPQLRKIA